MWRGPRAGTMAQVAAVRVELMGEFRVVVDGREIAGDDWHGRRAAELVQLLALSAGRRLVREQAIEAFWPHLDPLAGAANLRKAAYHARSALHARDGVVLDRVSVALFPSRAVDVDVVDFERRAAAALAVAGTEQAIAVAASYPGDLLPRSPYEEWTLAPRRRLRELLVDLLRRGEQWARLVELDPTDEAAYLALIRDALADGDQHTAIRWYGRLRDMLATELGVPPSADAEKLYEACVADLPPAEPVFIGRQPELARATAALRAAGESDVRVIVLRGAAGIGKSAFARQLARLARRDGWHVAGVTAREVDGPYAPVVRLVGQLLAYRPDVVGRLPDQARAAVTELTSGVAGGGQRSGPVTRHRVAGALRRLYDRLGGAGVLVTVDDADRADEATRDVLLRLLDRGEVPVVTVVAYRAEQVDAALVRELSQLDRAGRVVQIDLGPLTDEQAEALALASAAVRPQAEAVSRLLELAEGNPLLVVELARCVGVGTDGALTVAASAWDAIAARFLDLDERTLSSLRRLAVAGEDFDAAGVVAVTGLTDPDAFEFLDAALASGALVVSGARYRFRHALVRRALAAPLAPHQRIAVHRDTARRLADAGDDPALIAHHWLAGRRPGDAVPWLLAAARRASALGAFADARDQLERLLAHAPQHTDALVLYAEALDALGDARAADAYAAAARAAGEPRSHEIRPRLALALLKTGDPAGALAELRGATPTTTTGLVNQALTLSGAAVLGAGDPGLAAATAEEARRSALRTREPGALVEASWAVSLAAHAGGELTDRLVADLLATRDTPELAIRVFDGHLCATERLLYGARPYPDIIEFATSLAGEAERLGAARGRAFALTLRGEANLLAGRLADADADLADGAALHHAIAAAAGESLALQRRAQVAHYRDRPDEAATFLADALAAARDSDLGRHLFDRIYGTRIALSDPGHAASAIDEAEVSVRGPAETCPACRITLTVPAAIGAARAGDLDRASAYAQESELLAAVVLRLPAWYASVDEVHAHCALARGDHQTARARFGTASEGFRAAGQPLDDARCREWQSAC